MPSSARHMNLVTPTEWLVQTSGQGSSEWNNDIAISDDAFSSIFTKLRNVARNAMLLLFEFSGSGARLEFYL
ncbi:hypothetical protein JMJ77_0007022 [Colletotrichum scovillei]|uniref:Uncharacterized protein n=1 Tax=Colletotrichum scovillei TaxID=1209932 RepID=A0A9P7RBY6_9PEZI|nr:hypothetical protein JMJ77_0007022 [Colletotrichum scovillei]KAG7073986.1 hypothetical protein JMJ76_0010476 [Colletotrichum scovillei]KAG7081134.1 hypothetical protein JMJ78_0003262 [Colletotrichum scovillei]